MESVEDVKGPEFSSKKSTRNKMHFFETLSDKDIRSDDVEIKI